MRQFTVTDVVMISTLKLLERRDTRIRCCGHTFDPEQPKHSVQALASLISDDW